MEHKNSFLTGFLTGQRLKRWQAGIAAGDVPGGGTDFYQWAGQSGAPPELADPDAYAQFAAALNPRLSLNSDATLTWSPSVDDMPSGSVVVFRNKTGWTATGGTSYMYGVGVNAAMGWSFSSAQFSVLLNGDRRSWTVFFRESYDTSGTLGLDGYSLLCPLDGTYNPAGFPSIRGAGNQQDGTSVALDHNYGSQHRNSSGGAYGGITAPRVMYAGRSYSYGAFGTGQPGNAIKQYSVVSAAMDSNTGEYLASASFTNFLPAYKVTPHHTSSMTSGARPGSLAGSPVNEQARTFTHPVTGEIIPFDSFTYNFQTRTYTLTLPGGNQMDVAFGDNTIKITGPYSGDGSQLEGDTVEAMYPDNAGSPIVAPDGAFQKEAFLSGLAAGMASQGF